MEGVEGMGRDGGYRGRLVPVICKSKSECTTENRNRDSDLQSPRLQVLAEGTTINDRGGGGAEEIKKKNFGGPSLGKRI